jgi:group I intron endonuclease
MISGVYKITNPKGKIYIGSSKNIYRRFKSYKKLRCTGQPKLYNSLTKYGVENHIFDIIHTCDLTEIYKWERSFGELYDVLNEEKGLNLKLPNTNDKPAIYSIESRIKMSNTNKGKPSPNKGKKMSEEQKLKISIANKGKPAPMKGRKMSEESRKKMSLGRKGCKPRRSTKVLDTDTGRVYDSITQLSKELKKDRHRLSQHLSGKVKTNKYPNLILLKKL